MNLLGKAFGLLVTAALLGVFGLVVAVPLATGATTLTVLTGSMEPTIAPGALVAVKPVQPSDIQVGDIVTFRPDSGSEDLITHRVVAIHVGAQGTQWVTRGDANNTDDPPITAEQIRGTVSYSLPYLGYARQWLNAAGPAPLVGLAVVIVIAALWPLITRRRGDAAPNAEAAVDAQPGTRIPDLRGASS